MIAYKLDDLGWSDFEQLIQTLVKARLGMGIEAWGSHGDWGRDAYFEGRLRYPGNEEMDGPFVFQSKFVASANAAGAKPRKLLTAAVRKECAKIRENLASEKWSEAPNCYGLFSNTPCSGAIRDSVRAMLRQVLPNAHISVHDGGDICQWLRLSPEIVRSFRQLLSSEDLQKVIRDAISAETERQKPPIVSPTLVRLHTNDSVIHTLVEVRNPNDFPVYSVSLELITKDVRSESICFEMEKGDPLLEIDIDNSVKVSQDTVRVDGSIPGGGDIVILQFFTIPAEGSKRFRVFGSQPVESSASLSVQHWQQTPSEMFSGTKGTGSIFKCNKPVTIRRIGCAVTATPETNQICVLVGSAATVLTIGDGERRTNATGLVIYQNGKMIEMDGNVFLGWPGEFLPIRAGEFAFDSPPYQQNQNERAVEIVDSEQRVVFQKIFLPGRVQIYGMFPVSTGIWVADVDGNRFVELAKRTELTSGLKAKRIFKYPADKYSGKLESP